MSDDLPYAPRDAVRLGRRDAIIFDGLCRLAAATRVWSYPAGFSGDVAEMRLLDKVYWLYKGSQPIRRAEKHSGLESFFANQEPIRGVPSGFQTTATLRLSAVGDLMNHAYLEHSSELYRDVEDTIFGADIAMANLECVVLDNAAGLQISMATNAGPPLAMSHAAFRNVASRFTFLATACNHSIDFGERGVASTTGAIRDAGLAFHGVNELEQDARRAAMLERDGFVIGVVSHTFGVNGHPTPNDRPWIVNHTYLNREVDQIDFRLLQAQLDDARQKGADFVVAQLHWGMEFELYPRKAQVAVAHRIAEMGADAIIGHHPHVLQPVEYYRSRRDGDRVIPIFYSLGNLALHEV